MFVLWLSVCHISIIWFHDESNISFIYPHDISTKIILLNTTACDGATKTLNRFEVQQTLTHKQPSRQWFSRNNIRNLFHELFALMVDRSCWIHYETSTWFTLSHSTTGKLQVYEFMSETTIISLRHHCSISISNNQITSVRMVVSQNC